MFRNSLRIAALAGVLLLLVLSGGDDGISAGPAEKKITLIFRYEDYSALSSTGLEEKLIGTLKRYDLPFVFGVIPSVCPGDWNDRSPRDTVPLSREKADVLKNAIKDGTIQVALHGYSHQTICGGLTGGVTGFAGLGYGEQSGKISKAKDLLEEMIGVQVDAFIPPWNSYDLNTLRALEDLGFKCISAGPTGEATETSSLKFLPATCTILELRDAVETARQVPDNNPVIVVSFHQTSFMEINNDKRSITYPDFDKLMAWIAAQEDIRVRTIDQAIRMVGDLSVDRYIRYRVFYDSFSLLPRFLRPAADKVYFHSDTAYFSRTRRWKTVTALFYLIVLAVSIAVVLTGALMIFPKVPRAAMICGVGLPVIFVLISMFALRDLRLAYSGAISMAVLFGASAGVWIASIILKKQGRL